MISILIAVDHALIREGVKRVLVGCEDLRVAAECRDAEQLSRHLLQERFDVALLGLRQLPVLCGLRRAPLAVVLNDSCERGAARDALLAGAAGYLCQDSQVEELASAIREVRAGRRYVSCSLSPGPGCGPRDRGPEAQVRLSGRELQVLRRLALGEAAEAIARGLELSPSTVKTYRQRVFEKLGLRDNAGLVRYAIRAGLVN